MTSTNLPAYEPPTEAQRADAARWVEGFATRWSPLDPDALRDLMHPDTQNLIPPMATPADAEGVIAHFRAMKQRVPGLTLTVQRWALAGDAVFVEWLGSAEVLGQKLQWRGIDRVLLRDGRTYAGEAFWDTQRVTALFASAMASAAAARSASDDA
jgi:ketosteroid isomerase-like protein